MLQRTADAAIRRTGESRPLVARVALAALALVPAASPAAVSNNPTLGSRLNTPSVRHRVQRGAPG
ncbi:MAG: hypothetical protein ABI346_06835, partial [Candidatus Baltobacteraceae bacterium]